MASGPGNDHEGTPNPPGAAYLARERAWNFSLASRHATSVELLIYSRQDTTRAMMTRVLDPVRNKTGVWWHCRIPASEIEGAAYYAYRVDGPRKGPNGNHSHAFNPDKILLDPYARAIHFPPGFERQAAIDPGKNDGKAPLGVLNKADTRFDWGDDAPVRHAPGELVIYEVHVRGFTRHPSSGVPEAKRGTFAGLIEKIPYLKDLGVTALELMPVFQFDPQEGNYWGYMPLSFFAVHAGYASGSGPDRPWAARDEFRQMVRAMHRAGIEVIIDVVHNHTAEGDAKHPIYSLKGLDNRSYYAMGDNPEDPYHNFSGTGNSLNGSNPETRHLVIDSLRYWIEDMRVDGFRHDLASVVMRSPDGRFVAEPALAVASMAVRELHDVRHIVEPWDAAGGYLLGTAFPLVSAWQWNGKYRDDLRRFVRGDAGMVGPAMQRIYGSDDLFPDRGPVVYQPCQSVNFITSHDGYTLWDLVSYTQKRNLANGHQNQDGSDHEHSSNCGFEGDGPECPPEVIARRKKQAKNFAALLLLSAGTPMIRAGDEFLQTQGGNNNPYNQDNATTWLNWDRLRQNLDVWRFFRTMIAFRKAHPSIGRTRFWREDVRWHGVQGEVDWSEGSRCLAYFLDGSREGDQDLYVMVNMDEIARDFAVQEPGEWSRVVDTSRPSPEDICDPGAECAVGTTVRVAGQSVMILLRSS